MTAVFADASSKPEMNVLISNPRRNSSRNRLRRMLRLQQINGVLLCLAMAGIFGGFVFGLMGFPTLGSALMMAGFGLAGLLLIETHVVYPRLTCPACQHRFFLPDGNWHWLARVNPFQRRCLHCGLALIESSPAAD